MFGDDARTASKELDLTLTTRDRTAENPDDRIPMCGVPYHSSETYIARLIAKGHKTAVCFADLSTGEISVTEFPSYDIRRIENEIGSYSPSEAILGGAPAACSRRLSPTATDLNQLDCRVAALLAMTEG